MYNSIIYRNIKDIWMSYVRPTHCNLHNIAEGD